MFSGPITSWEIYGETVETVSDFIFTDTRRIMSRGKVRGGKRRTRSGVYRSSRKRFRDHGIGLPRTVVSGFRPVPLRFNGSGGDRSEERRVGKECRSRWSP